MDEWPKIIDLPLLSSLPYCNPLSRFRVKNPVRRNREPGRLSFHDHICRAGINCAFNTAPLVAKC